MPSSTKSFTHEYARGKRVWLGRAYVLGLSKARESARAILADFYRDIGYDWWQRSASSGVTLTTVTH